MQSETHIMCLECGRKYIVEYFPRSEAHTSAFRSIRVVVRAAGKVFVRARDGYIAGCESRPVKHEGTR